MKGLICSVYTDRFIDVLGVIKTNQVTLIGDGVEGPFEPSEDAPAVRLVRRTFGDYKYLHAEPSLRRNGAWYMASGKFIWTCDSRFPNDYPIALHDRVES